MTKKTFFFISIWPKRFASVPLQFLFLQNPPQKLVCSIKLNVGSREFSQSNVRYSSIQVVLRLYSCISQEVLRQYSDVIRLYSGNSQVVIR